MSGEVERGAAIQPEASPHDVMSLLPSSTLGVTTLDLGEGHTLRLCQEVGEGGFGTVYAGRSSRHERPIAIKMVKQDDAEAIAREVAIHERLFAPPHHAATRLLVRLVEHVAQQSLRSFLLLELCEGVELEDHVQQQPESRLSEALARPIAALLAEALAYMHDVAGVAHLDLNPGNVLLQPTSRRSGSELTLKLIDYGTAALLDRASGGWVAEHGGTPNYRAPERHELDRRRLAAGATDDEPPPPPLLAALERFRGAPADVYSLGATLFFCVTGRDAFEWDDAEDAHEEILASLRAADVPFSKAPSALSGGLRDLIKSALAFEPRNRPSAAQFQAHAWTSAADRQGADSLPAVAALRVVDDT